MAIQNRRGNYTDFAGGSNLQDGEFGIVMSGDTNTTDGTGTYISNGGGIVHRLATDDDISAIYSMLDSMYWKSGDTIDTYNTAFAPSIGYTTGGGTELHILVSCLSKFPPSAQKAVTLSTLALNNVRIPSGGYLPTVPTTADLTYARIEMSGYLHLRFDNSSTWGITNNTIISGTVGVIGTIS